MKKTIIFILCLVLVFMMGFLTAHAIYKSNEEEETSSAEIKNVSIKYNDGLKYYIINNDYQGEFDYQTIDLSEYYENHEEAQKMIGLYNTYNIMSYESYSDFCNTWKLNQKYTDRNQRYMIVAYASYSNPVAKARLANVVEKAGTVTLYLWEDVSGLTSNIAGYFLVVPIDSKTYQYEIKITYTEEEYNNIVKYGVKEDQNLVISYKPIIYIYPEKEMNVSVKLKKSSLLTVTYPKYHNEWDIVASPNGNLKDLNTGRNYYGLYYESKNHNVSIKEDGFVIEGKNTISFLEEKLAFLGLNEREINEFIIYWLPKLENNKYNYIRFETKEEIDNYMPLEVLPKPDCIIRVLMDYKSLNEKINVKEQKLIPMSRHGYSVVEWGGSEIE